MRNLIFVGLPGSGKSTVGRLCAKALNLPFVDADKFLEQREGRSVADIFASSGEGYFRLTGFGTYENTVMAVERMKALKK